MARYPTPEAIEVADVHQLLEWNRRLPSPTTMEQAAILERITVRLGEERGKDNAAYVRASKAIGWD